MPVHDRRRPETSSDACTRPETAGDAFRCLCTAGDGRRRLPMPVHGRRRPETPSDACTRPETAVYRLRSSYRRPAPSLRQPSFVSKRVKRPSSVTRTASAREADSAEALAASRASIEEFRYTRAWETKIFSRVHAPARARRPRAEGIEGSTMSRTPRPKAKTSMTETSGRGKGDSLFQRGIY